MRGEAIQLTCPECGSTSLTHKDSGQVIYDATDGTLSCECGWSVPCRLSGFCTYPGLTRIPSDMDLAVKARREESIKARKEANEAWAAGKTLPPGWDFLFRRDQLNGQVLIVNVNGVLVQADFGSLVRTTVDVDNRRYIHARVHPAVEVDGRMMTDIELDERLPYREPTPQEVPPKPSGPALYTSSEKPSGSEYRTVPVVRDERRPCPTCNGTGKDPRKRARDCPQAFCLGGEILVSWSCDCECHRSPNIMHVMSCCTYTYLQREDFEALLASMSTEESADG